MFILKGNDPYCEHRDSEFDSVEIIAGDGHKMIIGKKDLDFKLRYNGHGYWYCPECRNVYFHEIEIGRMK